ncbi:MAG: Peptide deformylase [Candidatus Uhrbacteria bacterium GW2011_GWE2_41_1153]|nr:MAG: Peptide deformylase [Candidatus Uhrbacteria bacterium GW2011_GWE2_41_1153]
MKLKVLTIPNELLREVSKEIKKEQLQDKDLQKLFDDMIETMKAEDGVGIAAPQIGQQIRAIVVTLENGPEIYINPEITKRSLRKQKGEEGCLSVPELRGIVERYQSICIKAIIFQHEIDHLDGILFIDRAKNVYQFE